MGKLEIEFSAFICTARVCEEARHSNLSQVLQSLVFYGASGLRDGACRAQKTQCHFVLRGATMRWVPKVTRLALTLHFGAVTRRSRSAAISGWDEHCDAEGLGSSGICERRLTFDLSGLPKAGPLEGRVRRRHGAPVTSLWFRSLRAPRIAE
jgi:hypothetical protein